MNCHHQIIIAKSNLQIYYPPPYERIVWHYKHANTDHIRKAMCGFNWERSFANKDVNEMVNIFNEIISNVLNNYIPHETIICNDQDPPWFNNKVKKAIQEKNQLFGRVKSNINNDTLLKKLQCLQNKLNERQYYTQISMKLMDVTTSAKTYWSILKRFLNDKRIPCIPPLFHDNKFITDFKEKAQIFNCFFFQSSAL